MYSINIAGSQQDLVNDDYDVAAMTYSTSHTDQLGLSKFWHLSGSTAGGGDFVDAWRYSQGEGVLVGIVDEGVNNTHADLGWAFDADAAYDPRDAAGATDVRSDTADEHHGTNVAGLISADMANEIGSVGGAQASRFTASYIRYGANFRMSELADIMAHQSTVDVSNNSWGFSAAFADNFSNASFASTAQAIEDVASEGRGGLGTVFVFAAGNGKVMQNGISVGDDSGFHNLNNSRFTIAVGAHDSAGAAAIFSSPGANVLLTAPGVTVRTTDGNDDGATGYLYASGTSFAAPVVSSAVALMLAENPNLGYRDVQEILAISARSRVGGPTTENGAHGINGGGLMFDREGGFGMLDAAAAVNLARNWDAVSTAANETRLDASFDLPSQADTTKTVLTTTLAPGEGGDGFSIDHVELSLNLYDTGLRDLAVTLISPEGTRIELAQSMANVGSRSTLNFTFGAVQAWGENPYGTWTVELTHSKAPSTFTPGSAILHVYGDHTNADDTYYVTGSFADLVAADAHRATFDDTDGGIDTLNFAAAKSAAVVDLSKATETKNAGVVITLKGEFENVVGTVKGDTLIGSDTDNRLVGDDGNDRITGGAGSDTIIGGEGTDTIVFAGDFATYTVAHRDGFYYVTDAAGAVDTVSEAEIFTFGDLSFDLAENPDLDLALVASSVVETNVRFEQGAVDAPLGLDAKGTAFTVTSLPEDGVLCLASGKAVRLGAVLSATQFDGLTFSTGGRAGAANIGFTAQDGATTQSYDVSVKVDRGVSKTYTGTGSADRMDGASGDDIIRGLSGNDTLYGRDGDDTLIGGAGADTMRGGAGDDIYVIDHARDRTVEVRGEGHDLVKSAVSFVLGSFVEDLMLTGSADLRATGNTADNVLTGNVGDNLLLGGGGDDVLNGGRGVDVMKGGTGDDVYKVDNVADRVGEYAHQGIDRVESSVSYALPGNVEDLTLVGTGNHAAKGNALANHLVGNAANNLLAGGLGMDVLTGGAGTDTFVFDTRPGARNVDQITDFSGSDRIRLDADVFRALDTGRLDADAFKDLAHGAVDADDHIIYDSRTGNLFYDADGSGGLKAVKFAVINNHFALNADDFLIA